ncbi:MAG: hypothetical protein L3K26_13660 [Candidatus Hydrogenedentes bacterium]|nr:hypothetical protein [Candidatus Hydrogenedentota bacterium]
MRHLLPVFLLLPLILSACSQPARQEITNVREAGAVKQVAPPKMEAGQRFGMRSSSAAGKSSGTDGPLGGITFHHEIPEGWEKVALTTMRQVNLRMTGEPGVECYFTFLPGGGGGLKANLNRWRKQMGQEDLGDDAIAALPTKPLFNQPAPFILIDGDYVGMGTDPKPDYRMYGLVLTYTDPQTQKEQAFFLKMTGPRTVLEGQESAFDTIASSLHAVGPGDEHSHGEEHAADDGHNHGTSVDSHASHEKSPMETTVDPHAQIDLKGTATGYQWTVPEGWSEIAPTMMRAANLTLADHDGVECYFTVLGGSGGGLDNNINRWRQQMGQAPLSAEDIAALPKHPLLGSDATFVTIDGTFGGMSGATQNENYRMYGLLRTEETQAFFVKMTGPQEALAAQEANFLAFSASLQGGSAPEALSAKQTSKSDCCDSKDPTSKEDMACEEGSASKDDPASKDSFNPQSITWTAPTGWEATGELPMRVVTYEIGDVECYITSLSGDAGGVDANINRWVGQMGQPQLDAAALAALPRILVLGKEAPMIDVSGSFTGMSGVERKDYKLLGTVAQMGDQTVFVKLIGPGAEVTAQKENFVAFCASIKP